MDDLPIRQIAIIGLGEVGSILASDLSAAKIDVSIFDALLRDATSRGRLLDKLPASDVRVCETLEDAIRGVELVIAAVTASAAITVAREAATCLQRGQYYLDINSVSPETKGAICREVERSKADFVEGAVTAPVPPQRLKVPLLLGGHRAAELSGKLNRIGMNTTAVSEQIGVASVIKMCRSVVMKGLAALTMESLFMARRYSAEDAVLASLDATYPNMGWKGQLPETLVGRAAEHSKRRAAEMREVEQTLHTSGCNSFMASATAELQEWLTSEMEKRHLTCKAGDHFSWRELADGMSAAVDVSHG